MPADRELRVAPLAASLTGDDTSLLDLVDSLLGKGVVVDGEVVLGLAGVDLIYLRLAALLAAADRVQGGRSAAVAAGSGATSPSSAPGPSESAAAPEPGAADSQAALVFDDLPEAPDAAGSHRGLRVHAAPEETAGPAPASPAAVSRWNPDPDDVRKGVMKLVLALAEFIRQLLERQAIRRMEAGTLTDDETERLGTALAHLEETHRDMAERAGLDPEEVNLDLGPLGRLV